MKYIILAMTIFFGFSWGFISHRHQLFPYNEIKFLVGQIKGKEVNYDSLESNNLNKQWATKIAKGGYILHIRHAMREKWEDVTAYDAIELYDNKDARRESYYRAVCLTQKGIEDSKLVGRVFEILKINVSKVLSSPSCRSRETAIYAFKQIDQIEPSILHRTAQRPDQHIQMGRKLREVIDDIEIQPGSNIVISGHGGTLQFDLNNEVGIVDVNNVSDIDDRRETGIIVIEKKGEKLIAQHKFNSIHDIANNLILLPVDDISEGKFLFSNQSYEPENVNSGFIFNHYNND